MRVWLYFCFAATFAFPGPAQEPEFQVTEGDGQIQISGSALRAAVRQRGYVSGVAAGSLVDTKTGFHDAGFGLDIVDWLMEPGSDRAYRDQLDRELVYEFGNAVHGNRAKRGIEGPQICTKARELSPQVIHGKDFVAVKMQYRYKIAAPGKKTGSLWEQTIVFPAGKRYFLSSDRITSVNASEAMFLRIDLPGHIKHHGGDTFSEVYLSYQGSHPSTEFLQDFAPDEKFNYQRERDRAPRRFIRAYRMRDPSTGRPGPWLAGMTLDPQVVSEAWCHQRGYVSMIEEIGGRKVLPGQSFGAAYVIGFFDSIAEMEQVYDQYTGAARISVDEQGWRLQPEKTDTPIARLQKRLEWFQDQKFGLFLHWGIYSRLGVIESWPLVWADRKWSNPPIQSKEEMASFREKYWSQSKSFNPTAFDPKAWAAAAKRAGMKYVVFTTKHHDGFSMFDSRASDFRITAPEVPFSRDPRADIAGQVFRAFREAGFGIGAYFSKSDWHSPYYWNPDHFAEDRNPNYDTAAEPERWGKFVDFVHKQVEELMRGYGKIDILWLDGGQVRPPKQDIQMDRLAAMARGYQPGLIVVNRTEADGYEDYRTPEQTVPDKPLLDYPWESCITMGTQWSFKPDDTYKSSRDLIQLLVNVVSRGGNLLLNIGPQPDGNLPPAAVTRLQEIGDWMAVNAEAIHGTRPMAPYKEGQVVFTRRGDAAYAIYLPGPGERALPKEIRLAAPRMRSVSEVRLLGSAEPIRWHSAPDATVIQMPASAGNSPALVFRVR